MRLFLPIGAFMFMAALAVPVAAQDHPPLHVDADYGSCSFDLHPELTQEEFEEFATEIGSILRFRPLADATTLGRGNFDVHLQYASTPIDDAKGAWNDTMSHPSADHPLGSSIAFPRLVVRYGVSDRVDLGAWGGVNPRANYGLVGVDTHIALLRQDDARPVSLSIRPSVSSLVGPSELWVANASIDVSVSRAFGAFSPYVGVATSATLAVERSDDVELDHATADDALAYAGVAYRWRSVVVAAEVEKGAMFSWGLRLGRRF